MMCGHISSLHQTGKNYHFTIVKYCWMLTEILYHYLLQIVNILLCHMVKIFFSNYTHCLANSPNNFCVNSKLWTLLQQVETDPVILERVDGTRPFVQSTTAQCRQRNNRNNWLWLIIDQFSAGKAGKTNL
jgi:hypothetical protein